MTHADIITTTKATSEETTTTEMTTEEPNTTEETTTKEEPNTTEESTTPEEGETERDDKHVKTEMGGSIGGVINITDAIARSETGWREVYPEGRRFQSLLDYLSTVSAVIRKYEGGEFSVNKEAFYLKSWSLKPCDAGLTSTTTSPTSRTTTTLETTTTEESDQTSTTTSKTSTSTATTDPEKHVIDQIRDQPCPPNVVVQEANQTITVGIVLLILL